MSRVDHEFHRAGGFSLIEVLVAVVVMSVGLLALAALQASLVRGSADAKARSVAVGLAEQTIEKLRDFSSKDGYRQLSTASCGSVASANNGNSGVGVAFTRTCSAVDRYVYDTALNSNAGGFDKLTFSGAVTATDAAITSARSTFKPGIEFKRVTVNVAWDDATGTTQSVTLTDTVDLVVPGDSATALNSIANKPRNPQTRIYDPTTQSGVIPIAVGTDPSGNNQSVASSDPKPVTEGSSGNVTTRFNVETFARDRLGNILEKNVDTAIASCSCTSVANSVAPNEGPFAPSFWDGDKFSTPKSIPAKTKGYIDSRVAQNERLCSVCCRDHHDTATEAVKFDPFRPSSDVSGDHNHYFNSTPTSTPSFTILGSGNDKYDETCRLVRVDGVYRVTTDPRLENLVDLSMVSGTPPTLDSTTVRNYGTFASGYINAVWTALRGGTTQSQLADYTPSPDGLAQTDPVVISVDATHSLTARGLYADWLSPEAKAKLDCVGAPSTDVTCQTKFSAYVNKDILQLFPFVAVNLTNIGKWSENTASAKITVRNDPIPTSLVATYVRGLVTGQGPTGTTPAITTASALRSSSGLTDQAPIDPEDGGRDSAGNPLTSPRPAPFLATRNFTVSGAASTTIQYVAMILPIASDPNFRNGALSVSNVRAVCTRGTGSGPTGSDPTDNSRLDTNEHLCTDNNPLSPVGSVTLTVRNYSYVNVTCSGGGYAPVDSYSNVVANGCAKTTGSGTSYQNATVAEYDYDMCPILGLPTGVVLASTPSESRATSYHPAEDVTSVNLLVTNDASGDPLIKLQRLRIAFHPHSDTANALCPVSP